MKLCKLVSLLLVLCMFGTMVLVSCESDDGSTKSGETSQTVSNTNPGDNEYQDAEGNYVAKTSGKKYDAEVITFLTCGTEAVYESEIIANVDTYKSGAEQTYPQIINDDLAYRMEYLEEEYGIIIEELPIYSPVRKNGEMLQTIIRDSLTSSEDYQVVVPCLYDGAALAMEGVLYNLLDVEGLQIEAPWWNQEFNESMTYVDQLYFTIGDIGLVNKACTQALFFNYELWGKYGLSETYGGTPYELVRKGKWTSTWFSRLPSRREATSTATT